MKGFKLTRKLSKSEQEEELTHVTFQFTMKLVEEVAKPYLPVPKARAADAVVVDVAPVAETHEAETMRLLTRLEEILRDHENQRAIEALARLREEIVNELKEAA